MEIRLIIEIPKGSKNKYEVDEKTGKIMLDRALYGSESFPFEYGYIEGTLGEDGDPMDVVLLCSNPTFPGCVIDAEPIGYLEMEDESGVDNKVIARAKAKIDPRWGHVDDVKDLPPHLLNEIKNFFETYKMLEPGKWVKVQNFRSRKAAEKLIEEARERAKLA
ncbi:MAG: inorganic diphosphatase [bacterium]|nr:inorganic diphosphatase [bacterium]